MTNQHNNLYTNLALKLFKNIVHIFLQYWACGLFLGSIYFLIELSLNISYEIMIYKTTVIFFVGLIYSFVYYKHKLLIPLSSLVIIFFLAFLNAFSLADDLDLAIIVHEKTLYTDKRDIAKYVGAITWMLPLFVYLSAFINKKFFYIIATTTVVLFIFSIYFIFF